MYGACVSSQLRVDISSIAYSLSHIPFPPGREGRSADREQAIPVERAHGIPSGPAPPYEQGAKAAPQTVTEASAASLIEDELDQRLHQLVTSASEVGSAKGEVRKLSTFSWVINLSLFYTITGNAGTAYLFETAPREEAKV
jgi:hypothetical protein